MVAIEVGATGIIEDSGAPVEVGTMLDRDLLLRVTTGRARVTVLGDDVDTLCAAEQFFGVVESTLSRFAMDQESTALVLPAWWNARVRNDMMMRLAAIDPAVEIFDDASSAVAEYAAEIGAVRDTIAVVSLRAAQSSVVIVENCRTNPVTSMSPALIHDEGGDDLDAAVLRHLLTSLASIDNVDVATNAMSTSAVLRQCCDVRESLSEAATESIQLEIPGVTDAVRLVRSEMEEIARPWVDDVVRMVVSALELYGMPVDALLLTGGVAAMPLVSQRLSADIGIEVFLPSEPALVAVRGAERLRRREELGRQSRATRDLRGRMRALLTQQRSWRRRSAPERAKTQITASEAVQHPQWRDEPQEVDLEDVFAAALLSEPAIEIDNAVHGRDDADVADSMGARR
ncbi:Hsp70 family protein [Microbacterium sp. YY-03]|uniref:Hsp70 family protein n=1 Tax=Microbacterium sp. YY-03 TaxID=3421636 RepID=UPI003D1807A0